MDIEWGWELSCLPRNRNTVYMTDWRLCLWMCLFVCESVCEWVSLCACVCVCIYMTYIYTHTYGFEAVEWDQASKTSMTASIKSVCMYTHTHSECMRVLRMKNVKMIKNKKTASPWTSQSRWYVPRPGRRNWRQYLYFCISKASKIGIVLPGGRGYCLVWDRNGSLCSSARSDTWALRTPAKQCIRQHTTPYVTILQLRSQQTFICSLRYLSPANTCSLTSGLIH